MTDVYASYLMDTIFVFDGVTLQTGRNKLERADKYIGSY